MKKKRGKVRVIVLKSRFIGVFLGFLRARIAFMRNALAYFGFYIKIDRVPGSVEPS